MYIVALSYSSGGTGDSRWDYANKPTHIETLARQATVSLALDNHRWLLLRLRVRHVRCVRDGCTGSGRWLRMAVSRSTGYPSELEGLDYYYEECCVFDFCFVGPRCAV
jgi:hypothetical protein